MSRRSKKNRTPQCSIPTFEVEFPLTVPPSFQETLEHYELARDAIRPLEEKWADFWELAEEPEDQE